MLALKVEKIGDQVAVILTEEALTVLNIEAGGVLRLEPAGDGAATVTQGVWIDDPHARSRAFLRRYTRSLQRS